MNVTESWEQLRTGDNPLNRPMFNRASAVPDMDPTMEGLGEVMVNKLRQSAPGELETVIQTASEMTGKNPTDVLRGITIGEELTPDSFKQNAENYQSTLQDLANQLSAGDITLSEYYTLKQGAYDVYQEGELPNVDAPTEPSVDARTIPSVDARTIPSVDARTIPSVDARTIPSVDARAGVLAEPTVFEKYNITPAEYTEWDWLGDVGSDMLTNKGIGILESFGLATGVANKNMRETSQFNRELKNKLKIKEAENRAAATKEESKKLGRTFTIYDEDSEREVVYRDVAMGTKGAQPHPYELGRWVVKEPKKPTDKTGKKTTTAGTKAHKDYNLGIVTEAAQNTNLFSDKYTAEDRQKLDTIDEQVEEAKAENNASMMTALLAQKAEIHTRQRGAWVRMDEGEQGNILRHALNARDERMVQKGITQDELSSSEYDQMLFDESKRVLNNLAFGTDFEKRREFRNDPRFDKVTQDRMLDLLGDEIGLDLSDDLLNFDWLDVKESGVTEKGAAQIRLLQQHPARFNEFLADLGAAMQSYVDDNNTTTLDPAVKDELIELIDFSVNQLYAGSGSTLPMSYQKGAAPKYNLDEMVKYIPEPTKYKGQIPGAEWKRTSQGWGYVLPNNQGWIPASKLR